MDVVVHFARNDFDGLSFGLALTLADKRARYGVAGHTGRIVATGTIEPLGQVAEVEGFNVKLACVERELTPGDLFVYPARHCLRCGTHTMRIRKTASPVKGYGQENVYDSRRLRVAPPWSSLVCKGNIHSRFMLGPSRLYRKPLVFLPQEWVLQQAREEESPMDTLRPARPRSTLTPFPPVATAADHHLRQQNGHRFPYAGVLPAAIALIDNVRSFASLCNVSMYAGMVPREAGGA